MKNKKLVIVSGFALFSMFFGAGNLMFPPTLGALVGSDYLVSMLGFVLTAVGLVMLGVVATTKAGGNLEDISGKLGNKIGFLYGSLVLISIGPGLAIPRTAATTHELIAAGIFPELNPVLSSIIFFGLVLLFVLRPSSVVNNIGKYLTPALLTLLVIIIVKGIFSPISEPILTNYERPFTNSFLEGYQTMDTLAALAFTSLIIKGFRISGLDDEKDILSLTIKAGLIATIGLCLVYCGLLYLGATTSSIDLGDISRIERLVFIAKSILGNIGVYAMALVMALACLTTAIGLTSTFSDFFERLTNGKVPYKAWVIMSTVFSGVMAINGVERIIEFSVPVLSAMYPVTIVLIFLNIFGDKFAKVPTYVGAVLGALFPTIFSFLAFLGLNLSFVDDFYALFPETLQAFVWIIPSVILAILASLIFREKEAQ
ncbi:branched-chain amino acid transport system II carrier protein [Peptoniphilus obesi]|uniref:branched-chain amino acid transport system II carrier protein n=1 Tax=Peptoniphilus obesi TaxID=1472765 RepID=UPI0004B0792A|nr:branched-chain amino acid transport system II carrier protein [Peptoniphilus obesi]